MPLPDEIRARSAQVCDRLDAAREFYVHTRQAWRVVQQIAHEGRSVGIVDAVSGVDLPASDLEPLAQRYVTIHLAESVFRGLSGCMEDWFLGLIRLWLTAYPEDFDLNFDTATGRRHGRKDDEVQIPLSRLLHLRDPASILGGVTEKVVRDLTYERPDRWFRYIDCRVALGCPRVDEQQKLAELKAARDCLEHNWGVVNRDYIYKSGTAARYAEGDRIQIDEPYLLECVELLRGVIETMTEALVSATSGSKPPRPSRRGSGRI